MEKREGLYAEKFQQQREIANLCFNWFGGFHVGVFHLYYC